MSDTLPDQYGTTTVLVVEDEFLIRMGAAEALADAGFVVVEAGDADEAVDILKSQWDAIRVVFTDVQMPSSINGVELAHHTRRNWPWIGLLIVSAQAFHLLEAMPVGSRFLRKPYDPAHVVHHVSELSAGQGRSGLG